MQQPISRRDVGTPTLSATIGGREIELASASMDRALPDPLTGGALTAASGDLVAVEGPDLVSTVATPWDPGTQWPPVPESTATVSMDVGSGPVSILSGGRVVSASGGTGGREVSVEVADRYQSLDQTVTWDALSAAQPSPGEAVTARYVGLQSTAVTDRILRRCGWFSTPPRLPYAALSVPGQGTMWPESGTCVTSGRVGNSGAYPLWGNADWGVAATDAEATYTMAGAYSIKDRGRVELTAMTMGQNAASTSRIDVQDGNAFLFRLAWSDTTGTLWVRSPANTIVSAISIPRVNGLLYASMEYVSDTMVLVSIRSGGAVQSTTVSVSDLVTTRIVRDARISVTGRASGFQVAFPSTAGALSGWVPNAALYPRQANRNNLMVVPPVEAASCTDLLAQQCEAECATYWIDETGVLRWWDLARLEAAPVVAELTSDDDIADAGFTWSHSLSSVRSRATVKWREPLRDWSWRYRVDLWQGNGRTLNSGEVVEEWINVPADEVWLGVDFAIERLGDGTPTGFNNGWGSWYGAVIEDRDEYAQNAPTGGGGGSLLMTIQRVTDGAFKYSITWTGSAQAVMQTMSRDVSTEQAGGLWRRRRDFDLPILRGKAKIVFSDMVATSIQDRGDSSPEHVVDAGWWIQDAAQAQYTANYYGARVTVPQPVLSSVALIPVPGLQLGDMVTVKDTAVTRLTIRGLVIEDSRSINADMDMAHAVAIRPLSVIRNSVTWEEWGRVMDGRSWQSWGEAQQPKTWEQWGQNPLDGEES